jgi:exodeoxyribonuclease V alpha subunit
MFGREGEAVEGVYSVDHITYANPDTGYAVVRMVPADMPDAPPVVAVGQFREPRTGECYRLQGTWRRDPQYGLQVRVTSAMPEAPRSLAAIERYLSGASIKGLGPHYAHVLVKHFGENTFRVLEDGGRRLEEVPGIGPVRARTIRASWAEHRGIHDLMVNLQGVAGLTPAQAQRIYQQFGQEAWSIISQDPYRLAETVRGFGFKTCDRIARQLGIAHDAPQRLQAGVIYVMQRALDEGHLWTAPDALREEAATLLEVPAETVAPEIDHLLTQSRVVAHPVADGADAPGLYLPHIAHVEERLAERLAYRLRLPPHPALTLSAGDAEALVGRLGHAALTDEQRGAIVGLLVGVPLVVLTGGPGTGKTTTVRSLIDCLEARHVSYALCATTGRAAKQLAASTGRQAATVHRHLGIGGNAREVEFVRETVLIVDEASMIDIWLMDEILRRLREDTHVVLVGDIDQLPSVGPGAVLQDIISAAENRGATSTQVVRLGRIFRQEAGDRSMIVVNCHRIRQGQRPIADAGPDADYFEMMRDGPQQARELVVDLATSRLPRYLNIPATEVQVLAPMHGGEAGIRALNGALQQALNPPGAGRDELVLGGVGREPSRVLRVGDKVRQTRNNYQKQVYNGDLGIITRIDAETRTMNVTFDEHHVAYSYEELDELVHAWAMTVHSAQGSQWPAVVIVMLTSHYVMLERNILYTALSRARQLAVLVTQEQALQIAVAADSATHRRTGLVRRLQASMSDPASHSPLSGRLF